VLVSFVAPHFPLTAPPEHYYRYARQDLPLPKLYAREQRPVHPYLNDYRESFCYYDYFETEADVRRAIAGYFGLVSYLDENIGKILRALEDSGLSGSTRVTVTEGRRVSPRSRKEAVTERFQSAEVRRPVKSARRRQAWETAPSSTLIASPSTRAG
jgi:hypothetical protein